MNLKIGLFSDSFAPCVDGVANAVLNYAEIIRKQGGESAIITPRYRGVRDNYPFPVLRYDSVRLDKKIPYRAGNPFDMRVIRKLKKANFDLLHSHAPFASSVLAQIIAADQQIPVVTTYHTKFDIELEEKTKGKYFRQLATEFINANLHAADEVWVVSSGAAQSMRNIGYTGNYYVMENGTDFPRGSSSEEAIREFNEREKLAEDELVLIFVGRMNWYKNLKMILDGYRELKSQGIKIRAYCIGDGTEAAEIKEYSASLGLDDGTVRFPGMVTDRELLKVYYSRADLFVFPSTFDTSGLVVKEAAACGCPCLLVKGSCAAEGVVDGENGFLCEENDTSYTRALTAALNNRDLLKEAGENACRDVYMSWEDAVAKAYERYEVLVDDFRAEAQLKRFEIFSQTFRSFFNKLESRG